MFWRGRNANRIPFGLQVMLGCLLVTAGVSAADLYQTGTYQSLTADRRASRTGDIVTLLVYENSSASNTADTSTQTSASVQAKAASLSAGSNTGQVSVGDTYGGRGQIQRTGRLLATISAAVTQTLPSGDLIVAGTQVINVNGETTKIHLQGRVRPVDIAQNNTVPSNRLAEAKIDYVGQGFITDRTKPGIVPRVLAWLGLW